MPLVVTSYSSDGTPQRNWRPYRTPRWPENMLGATFFLFPSREDAQRGSPLGGCGFFVGRNWESDPGRSHAYAVTCDHVVTERSWIRTAKANAPYYIDTPRSTWHIDRDNDLAVKLITDASFIEGQSLPLVPLTQQLIDDYSIGIGDEVVAVGRFVDFAGHRTNRPLVRSGVIAAMPEFPVSRTNRPHTDSYIVEMRSRSGFSGSAVFVYLAPPQIRYEQSPRQIATTAAGDPLIKMFGLYGPWLLGVHWGEITIEGPDAPPIGRRVDVDNDRKGIEMGSGMIGVVPSNRLVALLETKEVARERQAVEAEFTPQAVEQSAGPIPAANDENPTHREDFKALLNAAAKTPPQAD